MEPRNSIDRVPTETILSKAYNVYRKPIIVSFAALVLPSISSWLVLSGVNLPVIQGLFFACEEGPVFVDPALRSSDDSCYASQAVGRLIDMLHAYPWESAFVVMLSSAVISTTSVAVAAIFSRRLFAISSSSHFTIGVSFLIAFLVVPWTFLGIIVKDVTWVAIPIYMEKSTSGAQDKPSVDKSMPDVLLVMIDDMNMDWTESYANFTPNLDKFAQRPGTTNFVEAFAQVPKCCASRVSLLTGISVGDSGIREDGSCLAWRYTLPQSPSLPEHLHNWYGYETLGSGKIYHSGGHIVDLKSSEWTEYWPSLQQQIPTSDGDSCTQGNIPWGDVIDGKMGGALWTCEENEHVDGLISSWAAKKIKETENSTTPLFIAAGLKHPHLPWMPDQKALKAAQKCDIPAYRQNSDEMPLSKLPFDVSGKVLSFIDDSVEEMSGTSGLQLMVDYYSGATSFLDRHIGNILDAASTVDRPRITIIISDHGFALGERGHIKKYVPWRLAARAPFMIHDSRIQATSARTWDRPVSFLSLFPTLIDGLCSGRNITNCRDRSLYLSGQSLWPIVNREESSDNLETMATVAHAQYVGVRAAYSSKGSTVKYGPSSENFECFESNDTKQQRPLGECDDGRTSPGYREAFREVTKFDFFPNKPLLAVVFVAHALIGIIMLFLAPCLYCIVQGKCRKEKDDMGATDTKASCNNEATL
jgi:arylsulfatase A-like enzyme